MGIWCKIKNFLTGKSNKTIRNYLITLIIITILPNIDYFNQLILKFSVKILYIYLAILFYIWCIFAAALSSAFFNFMFEKIDEKLYKSENKYNKRLFIWLGEDSISTNFIYKLFNAYANTDFNDIANLKAITTILKTKTGDNLINYRLLKNHLEFKQKNNSIKKLKIAFISVLGTSFTALITPFIKKLINIDHYIKTFNFDSLVKFLTQIEYFSSIFVFLGIGFIVYFMILTMYSNLTMNSRRINYLISILDVLIKDKESSKEN